MSSRPTADDTGMVFVMSGLAVWFVLSVVVAVVLGRGIRLADRRAAEVTVLTTADLPTGFVPSPDRAVK